MKPRFTKAAKLFSRPLWVYSHYYKLPIKLK